MPIIFSIFISFMQPQAHSQDLECHHDNYEDFIFNKKKTKKLIAETDAGCQLEGINLHGKDLTNAHFTLANLQNAKIGKKANLTFATFRDADLTGADLRKAIINNTDFCGIIYDEDKAYLLGFDVSILNFCRE